MPVSPKSRDTTENTVIGRRISLLSLLAELPICSGSGSSQGYQGAKQCLGKGATSLTRQVPASWLGDNGRERGSLWRAITSVISRMERHRGKQLVVCHGSFGGNRSRLGRPSSGRLMYSHLLTLRILMRFCFTRDVANSYKTQHHKADGMQRLY